ncbi:MAG: rhodanese-like domain-containing protein [Chloroflexota bacterium]
MNRDKMLIDAKELLTKIDDPTIRIYDATILFFRKESELSAYEEYQQGHIPGAAFFDHQKFSDSSNDYMYMMLPETELATQIGNIGINEMSEVIFYTFDMLPSATRAWWILHYAGHNNVRVLNGGLAAWKEAGGAVVQGGHEYEPTEFQCSLRPNRLASKDEVQAAMNDDSICTVNTLTQQVYDKAHITGSSLLPCMDLMNEMTSFLPNDQIMTRLQNEAQHERIITYCGGGIAATVNAMGHLMAGNENVAVYDGSMDEWTGEGLPTTTNGGS